MKELAKIQKELKAPKAQKNSFGKYNYRSCEDILEAVKPLLGECTLTISDKIELIGDRYYVKATATLYGKDVKDTVSADGYARESLEKKGMDSAQITGAASSYARKYALNGLFSIDDTKDSDATNDGAKTTSNKKPNNFAKIKAEYFSLLKKFYGEEVPKDEIETAKKMTEPEMVKTMTELKLELAKSK